MIQHILRQNNIWRKHQVKFTVKYSVFFTPYNIQWRHGRWGEHEGLSGDTSLCRATERRPLQPAQQEVVQGMNLPCCDSWGGKKLFGVQKLKVSDLHSRIMPLSAAWIAGCRLGLWTWKTSADSAPHIGDFRTRSPSAMGSNYLIVTKSEGMLPLSYYSKYNIWEIMINGMLVDDLLTIPSGHYTSQSEIPYT